MRTQSYARAAFGASLIAMAWVGVASAQTASAVEADASAQAEKIEVTGVAASTDRIDAKQEARDPGDVIVTGTRIVRPNMESNAPITTIDATYLKERGLARVEDALAQLPQVTPMLGLQGQSWTSGAASVGLRNLGAGRTLILLNGQRMDNDVNIIPGALIDRIDIMTGGASAVYGSDAIAGVVNFVLKRKFNGIAFDGEVSGFNHNNNNPLLAKVAQEAGYPYPRGSYLGGGNYFASLAVARTCSTTSSTLVPLRRTRRPIRSSSASRYDELSAVDVRSQQCRMPGTRNGPATGRPTIPITISSSAVRT